jgi:predicted DNA binding protein
MDKICFSIALLLLPGISWAASAPITFSWTDTQEGHLGYLLLCDSGSNVVADNIPPAARTITVPRIVDGKSHAYTLVAFNADDISQSSEIVIVGAIKPTAVTSLIKK